MISKPLVFLSSTSGLADERRELSPNLSRIYELYLYDWDRARGDSPEKHCSKMIEKSDVFLGVLGSDYGSIFPRQDVKRSIVEWEFETAESRSDLEILTFIRKLAGGESRMPAQQAFVERVKGFRGGHWCHEYATPPELVERVHASLEQWLSEFWVRMQEARISLAKAAVPMLACVAGATVLALCTVLILSLPSTVTRNALIGICASVASVVAVCGILAFRLIGGRND
jgi:hypothetical protein